MDKIKTDFKRDLIDFCDKNGVKLCPKCLLRFCDIKNFNIYKKANNELIDEFWPKSGANSESVVNCFSCLGLLSDSYCHQLIQRLTTGLNESKCDHKFNTFQLFISIPVSITLRNELLIKKFQHFCHNYINNGLSGGQRGENAVNFESIFSVKDIFRTVLIDGLEKTLIDKPFDINSSFNISLEFTHEESDTECQHFYELIPKAFFPKICLKSATKSFLNQSSILRALAGIDSKVVNDWTITEPKGNCSLQSIKLIHNPIYIAGRYVKNSRCLSQTPWILDGQRLMASSVQDIIQDKIQELIVCDQIKFSASGREDVDVRMLGKGRPFVLEVFNSRVTEFNGKQLSQMMEAINGSQIDVFVRDLQIVSKNSIQTELKEGENEKTKTYRALCCLSRPLTDVDIDLLAKVDNLVVNQKTPIRVLHRRTLSVRPKHIYKLWAERVTESDIPEEHSTSIDLLFYLNLTTEAGTYIKEFVHSDFGRTEPNLASVLGNCSADILQLDVMEINIDWPPVVAKEPEPQ